MRSKFSEIKKKYFIEDRVIKRHSVSSAKRGWLLRCGAIRGGGVAVGCAVQFFQGTAISSPGDGGPATTFWTTVIISAVCRAGLSEKSSHFPWPWRPLSFTLTCSVLFTSSLLMMLIHDGKGLGLNGHEGWEVDKSAIVCFVKSDTVHLEHTKPWLCINPFAAHWQFCTVPKGRRMEVKYLFNTQSGIETGTILDLSQI